MADHASTMIQDSTLKGKRIFIVEDNAANRTIQQTMLEQEGAVTITGPWSNWDADSLDKIRRYLPIHLILLDLMLSPRVSGYDIFQLIRSDPELAAIPIVAVSASNASEAIARTKEMGFNGFISKPVRYDTFTNALAHVINGRPVWEFR